MKKTLAILAGLTLAGSAFPAQANAAERETQQIKVQYNDLNLQSEKGMKILERRFSKAANEVCGTRQTVTGTRIISSEAQECYERAMVSARQQMAKLQEEQRRKLG